MEGLVMKTLSKGTGKQPTTSDVLNIVSKDGDGDRPRLRYIFRSDGGSEPAPKEVAEVLTSGHLLAAAARHVLTELQNLGYFAHQGDAAAVAKMIFESDGKREYAERALAFAAQVSSYLKSLRSGGAEVVQPSKLNIVK
jgi:hypothetical protein